MTRGTTSKLIRIFILDSSKSGGQGLTGLTNASSGLAWTYIIEGAAAPPTSVSLQSMTVGTWVSGGFAEINSSTMPGVYEIGVPNAALATGNSVIMMLQGAVNMVPVVLEIDLNDASSSISQPLIIQGRP